MAIELRGRRSLWGVGHSRVFTAFLRLCRDVPAAFCRGIVLNAGGLVFAAWATATVVAQRRFGAIDGLSFYRQFLCILSVVFSLACLASGPSVPLLAGARWFGGGTKFQCWSCSMAEGLTSLPMLRVCVVAPPAGGCGPRLQLGLRAAQLVAWARFTQ